MAPKPDDTRADPTDPATGEPGSQQSLLEAIERLGQDIRDLPAKLRVTLSPDDHRSIFEGLHGLFEKAGAFQPPDDQHKEPGEEHDDQEREDGHDRQPGKDSLARRMFGHS